MIDIHYKRKLILDQAFRYGEAKDDYSKGITFGEDELGKYILYHYPGYDYNYFYENTQAEFDRWEQNPSNLNFIKTRRVLSGFGKDDRNMVALIKYEGKYYICKDVKLRFGNTNYGSKGEPCYHITIGGGYNTSLIKTERAFKIIFNKLDKYEL